MAINSHLEIFLVVTRCSR